MHCGPRLCQATYQLLLGFLFRSLRAYHFDHFRSHRCFLFRLLAQALPGYMPYVAWAAASSFPMGGFLFLRLLAQALPGYMPVVAWRFFRGWAFTAYVGLPCLCFLRWRGKRKRTRERKTKSRRGEERKTKSRSPALKHSDVVHSAQAYSRFLLHPVPLDELCRHGGERVGAGCMEVLPRFHAATGVCQLQLHLVR